MLFLYFFPWKGTLTDAGDGDRGEGGILQKRRTISKTIHFKIYLILFVYFVYLFFVYLYILYICIFCVSCIFIFTYVFN